jgi:hypothetical protein
MLGSPDVLFGLAGLAGDWVGVKKNRRVCRRFLGNSFAPYAPSLLSIRQRSEIAKKVKIKQSGHNSARLEVISALYRVEAYLASGWHVKRG